MKPFRWFGVLLVVALLLQACGGQRAESGAGGGDVVAVVVGWDPILKGAPPPKRTTDPSRFAPLLQVLERITERANPPDLIGPPVHITLELKGGKSRRLELWGGYLSDREAEVLYWVPEELHKELREALEPLVPPPIGAPAKLSGMITVGDLVGALREHGAEDATERGSVPFPLFGATSGQLVELLGQTVQVYTFPSPAAAAKIAAQDPNDMPIDWIAKPRFVAVGNLLVTVVIPDQGVAAKVVAYLEMVRAQ